MNVSPGFVLEIARGEDFDGPQLVFRGFDATGCHFRWTVATAPGASATLALRDEDGTLVVATTYTRGVPTTRVTPAIPGTTIAGIAAAVYVHDIWLVDSLGHKHPLVDSAAFRVFTPVTSNP